MNRNLETFSNETLALLFLESRESPLRRSIHMAHDDLYTGPHVGLNIIQPDSYIQPHLRYADESIIWYSGKLVSIQLEDAKKIKKTCILSQHSPYLFLPKRTYHTVIALEPNSAIWMVIQGPHDPKKFSEFLSLTPKQNENYQEYFEFLRNAGLVLSD
ncbi:MAG: WbuC family cupin fold metalloprotein [Nanoarchaeota archaeon]